VTIMKKLGFFLLIGCFSVTSAFAQMERERSKTQSFDPEIFWSGAVVTLPSVTQLPASNLNFTIQHAFGLVSSGIDELFGLDASSNIRFGLDYGVSDLWSLGIGRSRFDKVVDVRTKYRLITLMQGARPTHLTFFGNMALDTQKNGLSTADKASFYASLLLARSITEKISIQVSPAFSHFNHAKEQVVFNGGLEREENNLITVGLATRYRASERVSALLEYVPVIGDRSDGSHDAFSVGIDVESGGHVFQLFLTSTQWIVPQYVASKSRNSVSDGDLGFGFTIHRVFGVGI